MLRVRHSRRKRKKRRMLETGVLARKKERTSLGRLRRKGAGIAGLSTISHRCGSSDRGCCFLLCL
jgi:hypothetical protein